MHPFLHIPYYCPSLGNMNELGKSVKSVVWYANPAAQYLCQIKDYEPILGLI